MGPGAGQGLACGALLLPYVQEALRAAAVCCACGACARAAAAAAEQRAPCGAGAADAARRAQSQPYCEADYAAQFGQRCSSCKEPIRDQFIDALSARWHPKCFACAECGCPLAGVPFIGVDDSPYCAADFNRIYGSKCRGCGAQVSNDSVFALGEKWHRSCFKCKVRRLRGRPCAAATAVLMMRVPVAWVGGTRTAARQDCKVLLADQSFYACGPDQLCEDCAHRRSQLQQQLTLQRAERG